MGVPAPHRASTDTSLAGEGLKGLLPAPRWLPLTTGVGAGGSEDDRGLGWGGGIPDIVREIKKCKLIVKKLMSLGIRSTV